jgi:hypothetical protein
VLATDITRVIKAQGHGQANDAVASAMLAGFESVVRKEGQEQSRKDAAFSRFFSNALSSVFFLIFDLPSPLPSTVPSPGPLSLSRLRAKMPPPRTSTRTQPPASWPPRREERAGLPLHPALTRNRKTPSTMTGNSNFSKSAKTCTRENGTRR